MPLELCEFLFMTTGCLVWLFFLIKGYFYKVNRGNRKDIFLLIIQ